MVEASVERFIRELGSKAAIPGGGSVAAIAGSMSAALCAMAVNLTIGKKNALEMEEELKKEIRALNRLSRDFLKTAETDAEAFLPLSKAYSLPSQTEAAKARKQEVLEAALIEASKPPLSVVRLCHKVALALERLEGLVYPLVISDVGCAAAMVMSSVQAAALNVYINAKMMEDERVSNRLLVEIRETVATVMSLAGQVYQRVEGKLCR